MQISRAKLFWTTASLSCALFLISGRGQTKAVDAHLSEALINVPVGLPAIPVPSDNPLTRQKIELGKRLFFERRLSENEGISCASCHIPDKAFADGTVISPGPKGPSGTRNTPTLVNVSLQPYQLWDGRSSSLEDQALLPVENPREMGSRLETVLDRLNQVASYRTAFQEVFGTLATRNTVAQALASFERTILSGNSAYDRYRAGDREAMRPASIEGMKLFHGKAHCSVCHRGPNLSNGQFHNLGVGWNGSRFADQGRFAVTGIIKDKGAFKTPTLRQVAQTAPYMHDGSLATLDEVVEFYNRGGNPNPHLDPLIQPRKLNAQEKRWLVEFLKSLTGDITLY